MNLISGRLIHQCKYNLHLLNQVKRSLNPPTQYLSPTTKSSHSDVGRHLNPDVTPDYLDSNLTSNKNEMNSNSKCDELQNEVTKVKGNTFASLLRNCCWTRMGDPVGKIVIGNVYRIVGNDLYVDFGHKFPTVVKIPDQYRSSKNGVDVKLSTKVKLLINDLEMSESFLGYSSDLTILESKCTLLDILDGDSVDGESDNHQEQSQPIEIDLKTL